MKARQADTLVKASASHVATFGPIRWATVWRLVWACLLRRRPVVVVEVQIASTFNVRTRVTSSELTGAESKWLFDTSPRAIARARARAAVVES